MYIHLGRNEGKENLISCFTAFLGSQATTVSKTCSVRYVSQKEYLDGTFLPQCTCRQYVYRLEHQRTTLAVQKSHHALVWYLVE